ncbi:MAG: VanZ family protein [Candidatus Omnitrophota bacterium]
MDTARKQAWIKYYIPSYIYAGLIFTLSSYPLSLPAGLPAFSDVWAHFIEYGIFGFLLARSFSRANTDYYKKYFIIMALLAGVACCICDEYYQTFVPNRMGLEPFDMLGDFFGVLTGSFTYKVCQRFC